ncbi:MAG: MASE1 domain-containing protein [Alphaproteobacteria bacterium]|nr:MASE1 domain-containing protein [Alphaproteobacteria bacterium]
MTRSTSHTAPIASIGLNARRRDDASPAADTGPGGWFAFNVATAAAYSVFGLAVNWFFSAYSLFPSPIWLPASVAVVAALAGGLRAAPGLFVGSLIVNYLIFDPPLHEALIISATNALGPVAGAALTRRLQPPAGVFARFRGVVVFIACNVLLHPALTASGGTFAIGLDHWMSSVSFDGAALYSMWLSWWLSDSGGALFFAPALLLWLGVERPPATVGLADAQVTERGDFAVWAAVAAISAALFAPLPHQGSMHWALPFLLVLPVSWVALRMSLRAAYSLISLVALIACVGTVAGYGPFRVPGAGNPLQLVGLLVVILALNVLTIVALLTERRAAEETSKVKSQFLANMSHDLRTPLNAIIGFADMIRSETYGPLQNRRYREYVDHIHEAGLMLLGLMNDILDLSKIEAGRRDMRPEMLDWRQIVDSALFMVRPRADAKGIVVEATATPSVVVYADDMAFRQILLNLLSNAVKFTPRDGRVAIAMDMGADGSTVLEVADTGIGMDAAEIRLALEPYGQVREVTIGREPGTGLGLPISLRLTEMHGGRLTIASARGKGTTVRVIFPPAGR